MIHRRILTALFIVVCATAAFGQSPQKTLKGYEMYSWQRDGQWYYSLLPATNRTKSHQEIMSSQIARKGTKAIRAELSKLPAGEVVFWKSEGSPGIERPATRDYMRLSHPKGNKVKKIMKHCDKIGIKLQLI